MAPATMREHFDQHFLLSVADSASLKNEAYKIRYQVYCQELGFERPEEHPEGLERDAFDRRSIHCLLLHRASGLYAGCVRLVLSDPEEPEAAFPFEGACRFGLTLESRLLLSSLPRNSFGEVSRLAVTGQFRRRAGEASDAHGVCDEGNYPWSAEERRHFPMIAVGLYLAATGVGLEAGLDRVMTMMEPRLARHLSRFGMRFEQLGDVVDYHGKRGPFSITREAVLRGMDGEVRQLLDHICAQIRPSLTRVLARQRPEIEMMAAH